MCLNPSATNYHLSFPPFPFLDAFSHPRRPLLSGDRAGSLTNQPRLTHADHGLAANPSSFSASPASPHLPSPPLPPSARDTAVHYLGPLLGLVETLPPGVTRNTAASASGRAADCRFTTRDHRPSPPSPPSLIPLPPLPHPPPSSNPLTTLIKVVLSWS